MTVKNAIAHCTCNHGLFGPSPSSFFPRDFSNRDSSKRSPSLSHLPSSVFRTYTGLCPSHTETSLLNPTPESSSYSCQHKKQLSLFCSQIKTDIPPTARLQADSLHFMYSPINAIRLHPPLALQTFRIPRKPCSPHSSSGG